MDIKTKFNIGDTIWFLHDNKVIETIIRKARIEISNKAPNAEHGEVSIVLEVIYLCNREDAKATINVKVEEQFAFKSKSDLLKSL